MARFGEFNDPWRGLRGHLDRAQLRRRVEAHWRVEARARPTGECLFCFSAPRGPSGYCADCLVHIEAARQQMAAEKAAARDGHDERAHHALPVERRTYPGSKILSVR